ncbi:MAG TPA: nucleotidyltransferase domain-containing protein [Xanthobacteraceae bacterium]|jgi:predicted nucleotidyltransferase|nr:nucleotidyltransferase domain-containing protein [Xanthobacteraceae bacterium]
MPEHGGPSASVPAELLESVVAHFQPRRVILFGSRARREASADSDIDLLVELDDDAPAERLSAKAVQNARSGYHGAVDIIPCRAGVLALRARAIGSFAHTILREGVTIYERQ